jgi:lipid-binding SYLF domain-containing protein
MKRLLMAAALLVLPGLARAQSDMQSLVDRSALTLQDFMQWPTSQQPHISLGHARAVVICPRIFKAGFFFAGAGGNCVLVSRAGNGTWSYPAFYALGTASFGLQIGLQDSEILMLIMTDRGLNAVLDSSVKLGAGMSVAIAVLGAGVEGDTTTAVGADILVFAIPRGAFAGISLEGSVLSSRTGWDQEYYGQPVDARQIVIQMQGRNPGADPLRELLTRYGAPMPQVAEAPNYQPPTAAYPPPATGQPPASPYPPPAGYSTPQGSPGQPINLQPGAPIQQQNLPPPR